MNRYKTCEDQQLQSEARRAYRSTEFASTKMILSKRTQKFLAWDHIMLAHIQLLFVQLARLLMSRELS